MKYNTEMNDLLFFFEIFPHSDLKIPTQDYTLQTIWQGNMSIAPDGSKACFNFTYALGFDTISCESLTVHHHLWSPLQASIKYMEKLKINFVEPNAKVIRFTDISVTDSWIYLYCNHGDEHLILKFSWGGELKLKYLVHESLKHICVDKNDRYVYAVTEGEESDILLKYVL